MFEFRIINLADGTQIIDETLKTSYDSLTALQMEEYIEVSNSLTYIKRMNRKDKNISKKRNILYKFASACGII